MERVPVIDHRHYRLGTDAERDAFVHTLGEALERFGFVNVVGHQVPDALLDAVRGSAAEVFALPEDTLAGYERPETARQRGYTPFLRERAKDVDAPDLKRFWHVGRDVAPGDPLGASGVMPPNVFPAEVPAFESATRALFDALEGFAVDLLHGVAAYLGYPIQHFRDLCAGGNSVLRIIDYPDCAPRPGSIRAAAHEDVNLLTVLPAASRPGLELMNRDGAWLPVAPPPGAMVCDTGDMFALLTGGRMPATTHRVVNPPQADGGRMSTPFFLHPHPDAMLAPLDGRGPPVRAHDYLMERLVANRVA